MQQQSKWRDQELSPWTHPMCESCWKQRDPTREPYRLELGSLELCCFCGAVTCSGIFVRNDPKALLCKGQH